MKSPQAPHAKQVGIWIRVSTEDQARGESPEHHEKRARLYAEAKGWRVREVYHLEAVSGKAVMAHPEAQRMLKDIKSEHITGLIFSKLARLARNTRELLDFADIFREYGADLISLQESIDTTSPAGRLFYTMIAAMAQWEREEIAERVAISVPIRAKLGKQLGGQAPFGYQWKEQKLIPDPKEAPVRKLMYELFREHRRKKAVARLLNERGYRTRNGSPFSDTTVERLLRDPTAKGLRRANYTKTSDRSKGWQLKPESDWVLHSVPAVVPEELWSECNRMLDALRAGRKPIAKKPVHLFAGFAVCGCGQRMYVPSNTPKYVCYNCRTKIPIVDLEGIFHEQLKSFVFSPEEVTGYLKQADEIIRQKEGLLEAASAEERKLRREMDKLYELYLAEQITKDGFGGRYLPLSERLKQLEEEQPKLQAEIDLLKIQYLSSDQILTDARDLYTRWPSISPEDKRQIVEAITEKINVTKEEVEIHLNSIGALSRPFHPIDTLSDADKKATKLHRRVAILPFGPKYLKFLRTPPWPTAPKSLGEHLRRRRLQLGLRQADVARELGIGVSTVLCWEKGLKRPADRYLPAILRFLGYDPLPTSDGIGEQLRTWRRRRGLSAKAAAKALEVDEGTLSRWERGIWKPKGPRRKLIDELLSSLGARPA